MKVWADHQMKPSVEKSNTKSDFVKCPFCREDFSSINELNKEYQTVLSEQLNGKSKKLLISEGLNSHFGCMCRNCKMDPIRVSNFLNV